MTPEQVFAVANSVALVSWVLLATMPRRAWVTGVLTKVVVPAALALTYTAIIAVRFSGAEGGFSSLSEVARLFSDPWLLLAGWIHYLAFDLLIGAWEVRDAQRRGVPHLAVVPCLILTFLFGPAGWGCYLLVRAGVSRSAGNPDRA